MFCVVVLESSEGIGKSMPKELKSSSSYSISDSLKIRPTLLAK